jgi:hypothetical protein
VIRKFLHVQRSYGMDKFEHMHAHTHKHLTAIWTTMSSSLKEGLTQVLTSSLTTKHNSSSIILQSISNLQCIETNFNFFYLTFDFFVTLTFILQRQLNSQWRTFCRSYIKNLSVYIEVILTNECFNL